MIHALVATVVLSQAYARSRQSETDLKSQCLWWKENTPISFRVNSAGNDETPGDSEFRAIAASFAVRGWALRVVGLLVALVAVAVAVPAVQLLVSGASSDRAVELAELSGHPEDLSTTVSVLPALLALLGAVAALGAAVLLMRKPPVRGGLSSKYDNPAARREAAAKLGQGDKPASDEPVTQRMLWDALDAAWCGGGQATFEVLGHCPACWAGATAS